MEDVRKNIKELIEKASRSLQMETVSFSIDHPTQSEHGDYATNVALVLAKTANAKPRELAIKIVQAIEQKIPDYLEKIEIAGPGFINFYLSKKFFVETLSSINMQGKEYGKSEQQKQELVFVEHSQPNTNKPLHIGHLRNSILGMSYVHLLKTAYERVQSTNINNDRGIANIKAMWAFLIFGKKDQQENIEDLVIKSSWKEVLEQWLKEPTLWRSPEEKDFARQGRGDYFVGEFYVQAETYGENNLTGVKAKKDWAEMLQTWEDDQTSSHEAIRKLWKVLNDWFYKGSRITMRRLGVEFTLPEEYESELYKRGKVLIEEALKGHPEVVRLPDNAIQIKLEKFGLPDKILVRRDGTAIYMTFDIELTRKRVQELGMEKGYWVVGSDQDLYFKQLFATCEVLGLSAREKLHHLSYGMVRLTTGKLSSRKGRVIYADDVLEMAVGKVSEFVEKSSSLAHASFEEKKEIAEIVGVGAVKYAMLKVDAHSEILFDLEKSVSLQGNSGPYIQYTYTRALSVLEKAGEKKIDGLADGFEPVDLQPIEKMLYQFPEVVHRAVDELAPHHVCTYLFEVAQAFNSFYAEQSILNAGTETQHRVLLTSAVATVIKNGLSLLGISTPGKM